MSTFTWSQDQADSQLICGNVLQSETEPNGSSQPNCQVCEMPLRSTTACSRCTDGIAPASLEVIADFSGGLNPYSCCSGWTTSHYLPYFTACEWHSDTTTHTTHSSGSGCTAHSHHLVQVNLTGSTNSYRWEVVFYFYHNGVQGRIAFRTAPLVVTTVDCFFAAGTVTVPFWGTFGQIFFPPCGTGSNPADVTVGLLGG